MKKHLFLPFICLLFSLVSCKQPPAQTEDWISLFNGKDLSGWDIKIAGHALGENYKNTFLVEDSMIRINYNEYESFGENYGHMYYQTPYSHYKIRFDYRFVGNQTPGGASWNVRNSGIMFHSQSAKSVEFGQHFPVSIELQLLGGLGEGSRTTANLCTPGTMVEYKGELDRTHCISSQSETYHGDQWVHSEALVLGDSIVYHFVEGDTVLVYEKPQIDSIFIGNPGPEQWNSMGVENYESWAKRNGELLQEGYIALQAESHPIDFKNIELLNLKGCMDPKAKNYRSYYVVGSRDMCTY